MKKTAVLINSPLHSHAPFTGHSEGAKVAVPKGASGCPWPSGQPGHFWLDSWTLAAGSPHAWRTQNSAKGMGFQLTSWAQNSDEGTWECHTLLWFSLLLCQRKSMLSLNLQGCDGGQINIIF